MRYLLIILVTLLSSFAHAEGPSFVVIPPGKDSKPVEIQTTEDLEKHKALFGVTEDEPMVDRTKEKMDAMLLENPNFFNNNNTAPVPPQNPSNNQGQISVSVTDKADATTSLAAKALNDAFQNFENGNTEAAVAKYKQVLEQDKKNVEAMFGLGASYQILGQTQQAIKNYMQILEIDPNYYAAKNNLLILIAGNTPEKAISELQKINSDYPNNAFVLAQMGTIYSSMEKPNDAIINLGKAIEIEPSNPMYSYNMAITLDKMQQYADAYKYYEHTINLLTPSTMIDKQSIINRMEYIKNKPNLQ